MGRKGKRIGAAASMHATVRRALVPPSECERGYEDRSRENSPGPGGFRSDGPIWCFGPVCCKSFVGLRNQSRMEDLGPILHIHMCIHEV